VLLRVLLLRVLLLRVLLRVLLLRVLLCVLLLLLLLLLLGWDEIEKLRSRFQDQGSLPNAASLLARPWIPFRNQPLGGSTPFNSHPV
jgi:hypothetical protein